MVCPFPGPGEFVSRCIRGSPMLSVGVRTGGAAGSNTVGGSERCQSRFSGMDGLTIWIAENRDWHLPEPPISVFRDGWPHDLDRRNRWEISAIQIVRPSIPEN